MALKVLETIGGLSFWGFIAIKLAGTSLAAWSWWWLLMPVVPIMGMIVPKLGL
jgi:hypothetical protein